MPKETYQLGLTLVPYNDSTLVDDAGELLAETPAVEYCVNGSDEGMFDGEEAAADYRWLLEQGEIRRLSVLDVEPTHDGMLYEFEIELSDYWADHFGTDDDRPTTWTFTGRTDDTTDAAGTIIDRVYSGTDNPLRSTIDSLLAGEDHFVSEQKLQKLVFYVDHEHAREHGGQLTGATFKPYMYGPFSHDVREELEDGEYRTRPGIVDGNRTTLYRTPRNSKHDWEIDRFVKRHTQKAKTASREDLVSWSRQTDLFRDTPYDEPMDFSRIG